MTGPPGTFEQPPEPSSARLVLTLAVAGLLSGLAIVGAYETTLPTIEANNARALQKAVFKVVPGSALKLRFGLDCGPATIRAVLSTIRSW